MRASATLQKPPVNPWPVALTARGPGMRAGFHAHQALHLVLAFGGELRVRTTADGEWQSAPGVLTAPDTPHAIDAVGLNVLVVFLAPDSHAAATFGPALEEPVRLVSVAERDAILAGEGTRSGARPGSDEWIERAARALRVSAPSRQRVMHPRIRALLRDLRVQGRDEATSLQALADRVGLSPGRLMHVFTESVGIPLRPYLGWLRVQRAARAIVRGSSLTDSAHLAGFSDAAHMTRTFRRMMGVTPSVLRPLRCPG